ncbi:SIR2 family protein [Methylobacter sp. BlB1]|nr:SIR2 family protein [Methylobacter sp. BlB1]
MDIKEKLIEIFKSRAGGPFLFVGSGFSRRYLGLEDWKGLLSRFCVTGKPFEYYLAAADGDYPAAAKLLAIDFNEYWWKADEYQESVRKYKSKISGNTSALRIEICNYLSTLDQGKAKSSDYVREVEILSTLNVDGVITTNWDMFIEQIFPDYKTYIGQNELLFSNPQEIGEIYKIHGCASIPESLILTNDDYTGFNDRNAYLAAKLITIFVEHPIVFIGYSLSDENISGLLKAISLCVGRGNVEQFRKNLIFVQRTSSSEEQDLSDTFITIEGIQIPIVLVKTNDLVPIYEALDATKRKIPARVLRYCKEQLYELVKSAEPEKKICVVDIDAIDRKEDIEFLVGVGVVSQAQENMISEIGYATIETKDLILDLLHGNSSYDSHMIVNNVLKRAARYTKNVPVFKYLRDIGIVDNESYEKSGIELDKIVKRELREFHGKSYTRTFYKNYRHLTMEEIIEACTPENASAYIPFISKEKIDLDLLHNFLVTNQEKMDYKSSSYASNFRKLAVLYDKLKFGW